jgi:hypothetical protein
LLQFADVGGVEVPVIVTVWPWQNGPFVTVEFPREQLVTAGFDAAFAFTSQI